MTVGPARLITGSPRFMWSTRSFHSDGSSRSALHLSLWAILQSCFSRFYKHELLFWTAAEERDKRVHRGRFWPTPRLWWPSHSSQRQSAAVCWSMFMFICDLSVSVRMIFWSLHYCRNHPEILSESLQQQRWGIRSFIVFIIYMLVYLWTLMKSFCHIYTFKICTFSLIGKENKNTDDSSWIHVDLFQNSCFFWLCISGKCNYSQLPNRILQIDIYVYTFRYLCKN